MWSRALALLASCAALALVPWGPAAAQSQPPRDAALPRVAVATAEGDYLPDNLEWNGLADLFALARGLGLSPEMRAEITWSDLDDNTVLMVLYPRARLDEAAFLGYLQGGGRLVVADDFGSADGLLAHVGLTRVVGEVTAARLHDGNPHLPVAVALTPHELTTEVGALVTNHPAWLHGRLTPILGFNDRDLVCVTGTFGAGTLVVVSDPSVFINNMLEFGGNLAFATNLLRTMGRPGGRLIVVVGDFASRGTPRAGLAVLEEVDGGGSVPPTASGPVAAFLADFNRFLGGMADFVPPETFLHVLLIVGLATTLGFVAFFLKSAERRSDHSWVHPGGPPPRSGFEENLARYGDESSREGCGLLAGLVRDEVEGRLSRELGVDVVAALDPARAVPCLRARAGAEPAELLGRVLRLLARVPSAQRTFGAPRPMSRRQLARLHTQVEALFAALEAEGDTRRTGS